ncbi:MAG: hypothetical protein ACYC7E_12645 [Armatimonadota bacterium]
MQVWAWVAIGVLALTLADQQPQNHAGQDGKVRKVRMGAVAASLTSPSGAYRWLDIADQPYGDTFRQRHAYRTAVVRVSYRLAGSQLSGTLVARGLKPNFAYQLKLIGEPGTVSNERIGLVGRWWEQEWTGTTWSNGDNLNNKGDGTSPNPNDAVYFSRRDIPAQSPTGRRYRYMGYLLFDYFVTDEGGKARVPFMVASSYHVLWKTTQQSAGVPNGPLKEHTFDPKPKRQPAYATDYPENTVGIFGEWERLPIGKLFLPSGEYRCQLLLTEESFHGSGGALAGAWAAAMVAPLDLTISPNHVP